MYGTSKTQGVLKVDLIFATYNKVELIKTNAGEDRYKEGNFYRAYINYDTSVTNDYEIELTSTSGVKRIIKLSIINPEDEQSLLTRVVYNLNNGEDSANYSKIFVSSNEEQKTYLNYAVRKGYWFKGWFYDEGLEKELNKDQNGYFVCYDNLIQYETDTIYYTWRYGLSYRKSSLLYVYAKWEAKEEFKITAMCGDFGTITNLGETFVYDQDDITYNIVPQDGYRICKLAIDGVLLDNEEIKDVLKNGYTFSSVNSDHTIEVEFEQNLAQVERICIKIVLPVCVVMLLFEIVILFIKRKRV